ncbi:MAG TPA: AAA family ATPase, partial [Terracidiphilus sp.]|nr:AAA family ATPase [Terracidiphilus sp.]
MTKHFAAQCNIHQITAAAAAQEAMLGGDEVNHAQLKRAFEGRPDMAAALFSGVLPVDYIEMEQVDWLVEPFLAKGKLNIVHGDAGVGKSFVLQSICAALSLGADPTALVRRGAFNLAGKPQKALYCSVEADAATELRPRIEAMGGDPSKLLHIPADFPHVNTTQGRARIEGAIEAHKPALVIFDPITSFTKDLDPNSAADVRAALDPLSQMARTYDTCIVYLVHDKKVQGGKSQHKAGGSAQWVAAARAGFRAGQTQDGRKAIVLAKWNNASVCKACEYRIVSVLVMGANGEDIKTARLEWLGE